MSVRIAIAKKEKRAEEEQFNSSLACRTAASQTVTVIPPLNLTS